MPKLYSLAESVENIANRLIPNYHPELSTARIKYIYVDKGSTKSGRPVLGKVRKVSGSLEFLLETDFLIEVALDTWNDLEPDRRNALVDHLLERCFGEEEEESGEMTWKVREPDVQEFASILQRHGVWNEDLLGFVSIAQKLSLPEVEEGTTELAEQTVSES